MLNVGTRTCLKSVPIANAFVLDCLSRNRIQSHEVYPQIFRSGPTCPLPAGHSGPGGRTVAVRHHPCRGRGLCRLWRLGPRSAVHGPDGLALSSWPTDWVCRSRMRRPRSALPRRADLPRIRADPRLGATWNAQGSPGRFQVLVDGKPLATTFGTEGAAMALAAGRNDRRDRPEITLALHDLTGFEGRCDAIVLSRSAARASQRRAGSGATTAAVC